MNPCLACYFFFRVRRALIRGRYPTHPCAPWEQGLLATGRTEELMDRVFSRYQEYRRDKDLVIVEGTTVGVPGGTGCWVLPHGAL